MIYATKERAIEVAAWLTREGHGFKSYACRVPEGWTVIGGYCAPCIGQYSVLEVAL